MSERDELHTQIQYSLMQRLTESEQRYRALVDGLREIVFHCDRDGRLDLLNRAWTDILGHALSESLGHPLEDFVHDQSREALRAFFGSEQGNSTELRFRAKSGGVVWMDLSARRHPDGGWTGSMIDITERKQAEQERVRLIREQEARAAADVAREQISTILESIQDGFYTLDRQWRFTYLNHEAERLLGRSKEQLRGKRIFDELPGFTETELYRSYCRAVSERRATQAEYHESSSDRWYEVRVYPSDDGLSVYFRDSTYRRRAETTLRERTRLLETLNRVNRSLAAELDLDVLVRAVTDAGTELTGAEFGAFFYNVLDERGESFYLYSLSGAPREAFSRFPMPRNTDLFGPTFRGEGIIRLDDVTQDPRYGKNAPYHGMPAGHLPVRSYLAVPVITRAGEVVGGLFFGHHRTGVFGEYAERIVVGIAAQAAIAIDNARLYRAMQNELKERKRAEQRLQEVNESLEQRIAERTESLVRYQQQLRRLASELTLAEQRERRRLAQILHDHLQQILVASKMHLTILRGRVNDGEQQELTSQVESLVDDAIAASRSLTVDLSPPILYDGGLGPALNWLARHLREKYDFEVRVQASLAAEPATDDVKVFLFHAVRELLFNVIKHAHVHSAEVVLEGSDQDVQITVLDQGSGFDTDQLHRESHPDGGFGLFSIRERLELMGGQMEVQSRPGKGTRIVLRVPRETVARRHEQLTRRNSLRVATSPQLGRSGNGAGSEEIRVLLADDHAVLRDTLAKLLREQPDIDVIGEASDGFMAIELAKQMRPDVVIMDVSMPLIGGVEATRRIVEAVPEVRVIGLSMHEKGDLAAEMRQAGAVAYLPKGDSADALLAAIRAFRPRRNQDAREDSPLES